MLVAAENPVLVASRCARTPTGLKLLTELAETLQAGVLDQHRRMNFPTRHPLNQTNSAAPGGKPIGVPAAWNADVILGLESSDFTALVRATKQNNALKLISISSGDLFTKSNYQNFQRYADVDLSIAADARTLPSLIEACRS
jgi:thiamine pyrophosphate-dependent acetolactate synthase large subunit-like protein